MKLNFETYAKAVIVSYLVLAILSFLVSKLLKIDVFPIGYGFILVIVAVVISMVSTITLDRKIEKEEITFFIIVIAILIGGFFLLKHYVPEIFSTLFNPLQEIIP